MSLSVVVRRRRILRRFVSEVELAFLDLDFVGDFELIRLFVTIDRHLAARCAQIADLSVRLQRDDFRTVALQNLQLVRPCVTVRNCHSAGGRCEKHDGAGTGDQFERVHLASDFLRVWRFGRFVGPWLANTLGGCLWCVGARRFLGLAHCDVPVSHVAQHRQISGGQLSAPVAQTKQTNIIVQ
jgi:hypothetical protein